PADAARALRPDRARSDAARRRRPVDRAAPARRQRSHADRHADRQGRRRRPDHRARGRRGRLPAQAVQPARAACTHPCRPASQAAGRTAGRTVGRTDRGRVRAVPARSRHARLHTRRRAGAAHHRRVFGPQGPRAARAHAAVAREADDAGARSRIWRLRSQPRRPGPAPAPADRGGPAAAALHPDCLGRRVRVRPGRRMTGAAPDAAAARRALGPPRISLFWRTFLLLALLIGTSLGATLGIAGLLERAPPEQRLAWEVASVVNLTRSALVSAEPDRRLDLLDQLAREEEVRVLPREPEDRIDDSATGPR